MAVAVAAAAPARREVAVGAIGGQEEGKSLAEREIKLLTDLRSQLVNQYNTMSSWMHKLYLCPFRYTNVKKQGHKYIRGIWGICKWV